MKKLYFSLIGLALYSLTFGQDVIQSEGGSLPVKLKKNPRPAANTSSAERAKPFAYWIDPLADMIYNKGVKIFEEDAAKNVVGSFVGPLFQDSTVSYLNLDSSISIVSGHFVGSNLDLQSQYLLEYGGSTTGFGVVTAADPYNLDSLNILGRYYIKDSTKQDTLYVYLQWGKPYDPAVYKRVSTTALFGAPLNLLKDSVTCPLVKGAGPVPGAIVTSAAPASNFALIKYPLKHSDAVKADNYAREFLIKVEDYVGKKLTIPAGNILSLYYTYVPQAGSTKSKDIFYSFHPTAKAKVNGYGAQVWQQKGVKVAADYKNYMVDPSSKHAGPLSYNTAGRYGSDPVRKNNIYGALGSVPIVSYKVSGNSTVGINELNSNFSLEQNSPNPFSNETTIAYQLKAAAKNVSVVIYNVAGVKLFERTQTNQGTGRYTVEVNNVDFASGMYFYSLIVDGNQVTKKMIVAN